MVCLASPTLPLVLRPLEEADAPDLVRIHREPEVMRWWDEPAEGFPWDEPESTRFTIEISGVVAGLIQFSEESEPKYRHAAVDIFLSARHQGQGYGAEAVRVLAGHLFTEAPPSDHDRSGGRQRGGDRRLRAAGFRTVGVMRLAERDSDGEGWHDAVIMELVRSPDTPPRARND